MINKKKDPQKKQSETVISTKTKQDSDFFRSNTDYLNLSPKKQVSSNEVKTPTDNQNS